MLNEPLGSIKGMYGVS